MRSQQRRRGSLPDNSAAVAATNAPQYPKKKNKTLGLEQQVKMLEEENLSLRLQLKVGKESLKQDEEQKDDIVKQISETLQAEGGQHDKSALRGLLKSYIVRYSDWSSDHVDAVDNHMAQIQRLLAPTKVTKLALWALNQDDDFFKPVLSANESLLQIMIDMVEGTLDQTEEFKNYRHNAKLLTKGLRFTDRECADLRQRLKRKNRALAEEMHELQDILTPEQLAKFIVWANKNEKLQETLKTHWVGWTDPQQVEESRKRMKKEDKRPALTTTSPEDDDEDDEYDDDQS